MTDRLHIHVTKGPGSVIAEANFRRGFQNLLTIRHHVTGSLAGASFGYAWVWGDWIPGIARQLQLDDFATTQALVVLLGALDFSRPEAAACTR